MKYVALVAAALLVLTGCIEIDDVDQPTVGTVNETFDVELKVSSDRGTCRFSDRLAEVALTIPIGWEIGNCSFVAGSSSVPQVCHTTASRQNNELNLLPHAPGYQCPALSSIIDTSEYPVTAGVIHFTITPRSAGDFSITYIGSAHAYSLISDTKSWFTGGNSENNAIAIAPAQAPIPSAAPVPTIGAFGLGARATNEQAAPAAHCAIALWQPDR